MHNMRVPLRLLTKLRRAVEIKQLPQNLKAALLPPGTNISSVAFKKMYMYIYISLLPNQTPINQFSIGAA